MLFPFFDFFLNRHDAIVDDDLPLVKILRRRRRRRILITLITIGFLCLSPALPLMARTDDDGGMRFYVTINTVITIIARTRAFTTVRPTVASKTGVVFR